MRCCCSSRSSPSSSRIVCFLAFRSESERKRENRNSGWGKKYLFLISISPRFGLQGNYAQTKLALVTWTQALADDFKKDNIYLRTCDPGPNRTSILQKGGSGWLMQRLAGVLQGPPENGAKIIELTGTGPWGAAAGVHTADGRTSKKLPRAALDIREQDCLLKLLRTRLPEAGSV